MVNKCYFSSNKPKSEFNNNSGKDNSSRRRGENGTPERSNKGSATKFDTK